MPRWLQVDSSGVVVAVTDSARPVPAPAGWLVLDAAAYPVGVREFYTYDAARDKFTAPASRVVPVALDLATATDRQVLNAIARALGVGV